MNPEPLSANIWQLSWAG